MFVERPLRKVKPSMIVPMAAASMPTHRMEFMPQPFLSSCSETYPVMTVSAFFPKAFRCTGFEMKTRFVMLYLKPSFFIPSSYTPGLT